MNLYIGLILHEMSQNKKKPLKNYSVLLSPQP